MTCEGIRSLSVLISREEIASPSATDIATRATKAKILLPRLSFQQVVAADDADELLWDVGELTMPSSTSTVARADVEVLPGMMIVMMWM